MKKNRAKVFLIILVMAVTFLFSVACSAGGAASSQTIPTPSSVPTATPTATPSPTMSLEEFELNKKIQDFLNKSGEFTQEAIDSRLLIYRHSKLDLGWVGGNGNTISLQGWFFDYIRVGDYLVLAVGFDGSDGERHVKPIAIPISYFEKGNQSASISFEELRDWNVSTHYKMIWESNVDNVMIRLNTVKGTPVILTFYNNMSNGTIDKAIELFGESCEEYFVELRDTNDLVNRLASEISISNNESILIRDPAIYEFNATKIPDIQSVDDLKNIDISVVPRIFGISSNLW